MLDYRGLRVQQALATAHSQEGLALIYSPEVVFFYCPNGVDRSNVGLDTKDLQP